MTFSDSFTDKHSIKSDVDAMWTEFSNKCEELIADHVPSKFSATRFSQPWINRNLKRLSRREKKAYKSQDFKKRFRLEQLQTVEERMSKGMQDCLLRSCQQLSKRRPDWEPQETIQFYKEQEMRCQWGAPLAVQRNQPQ